MIYIVTAQRFRKKKIKDINVESEERYSMKFEILHAEIELSQKLRNHD